VLGDSCGPTCLTITAGCGADVALGSLTQLASFSVPITGATNSRNPSCVGTTGANGIDVSLSWTAPSAGLYQFDTIGSTRDTVLSVVNGCNLSGTDLVCDDDGAVGGSTGRESSVRVTATAGQTFVVWVDTYGTSAGTAVLNLSYYGIVSCSDTGDTDGDRILNCRETNDGVFVSTNATGTSPTNSDTDGDGLLDGDEVLGTTGGLNLPALGANPLRQDIFVEVDWFEDSTGCGSHSHRMTAASVASATTMFANAPVDNPDGSSGITLHVDYGQGGVFTGGNRINEADPNITGGLDGEFLTWKAANFAANRSGRFHYVVSAHEFSDISAGGLGEAPGDDFALATACWGNNDFDRAAVFIHELGHNLGLLHGGDEDCNNKPNYNSVMNYLLSYSGVDDTCDAVGDGALDFSNGLNPALNEASLLESQGVCGSGPSVDWNANGVRDTLAYSRNLNAYTDEVAECGGAITTLRDHDDWGNLNLAGMNDADFGGVGPRVVVCEF
jgi:hypothetical protein